MKPYVVELLADGTVVYQFVALAVSIPMLLADATFIAHMRDDDRPDHDGLRISLGSSEAIVTRQ